MRIRRFHSVAQCGVVRKHAIPLFQRIPVQPHPAQNLVRKQTVRGHERTAVRLDDEYGRPTAGTEQPVAQRLVGKPRQFGRILRQIKHDRGVRIVRVAPHPKNRRGAPLPLKQRRHPDKAVLLLNRFLVRMGIFPSHNGGNHPFVPYAQRPVEQLRLSIAHKPHQPDHGPDVGKRLVGHAVPADIVCRRKVLKAKRRPLFVPVPRILPQRPLDAFRAQRIGRPKQVDHVPARIAVFPVPGIRIEQVPVEQKTGMLVVEPDRVVAHRTDVRPRKRLMNLLRERHFGKPFFFKARRRMPVHQHGAGFRQQVRGGAAIPDKRFALFVQVVVGPHPGELHGTMPPRIPPGGFVIIPEKRHVP